jgi:hypothetical protein
MPSGAVTVGFACPPGVATDVPSQGQRDEATEGLWAAHAA